MSLIDKNELKINSVLVDFINNEAIPGTGIKPDDFWHRFENIVHELTPINKALIKIDQDKESLSSILHNDLGLKNSELELIDRAILYYGIYEIKTKELPKEVVIDECIRLSKKFSSPDSYKFINVYLDKYLKLNEVKKDK